MRVTRLGVAPVKGLRLDEPSSVRLGPAGAEGDRAFVLVGEDDRVVSVPAVGGLLRLAARWDAGAGVQESTSPPPG